MSMQAVLIREFGGPEKLEVTKVPKPQPGPNEVLIKILAAGVNPADWKVREGYLKGRIPHKFPIILGWDLAGEVVELGREVSELAVGDAVWSYCRGEILQQGAFAEYIALPVTLVGKRPKNMTPSEAATVPLAALTAYQALFEVGNLKAGETVLIQAAAGGVGSFAVQLAKLTKAKVIGIASRHNHQYLRKLGAKHAIGYRDLEMPIATGKLTEGAGVDLAIDCVGGEVTEDSSRTLNPGGRLVSIANFEAVERLSKQGINAKSLFVRPDAKQLEILRGYIEVGKLSTHISKTYPLCEAGAALERSATGHVRGKLVLEM